MDFSRIDALNDVAGLKLKWFCSRVRDTKTFTYIPFLCIPPQALYRWNDNFQCDLNMIWWKCIYVHIFVENIYYNEASNPFKWYTTWNNKWNNNNK